MSDAKEHCLWGILNATGFALTDLYVGSICLRFPPFFKAFALGFVIWLFIRDSCVTGYTLMKSGIPC